MVSDGGFTSLAQVFHRNTDFYNYYITDHYNTDNIRKDMNVRHGFGPRSFGAPRECASRFWTKGQSGPPWNVSCFLTKVSWGPP